MSKNNNKYKATKAYSEFIKIQILIVTALVGGFLLMYFSDTIGEWSIPVGIVIIVSCVPFQVLSYIRFGVDYSFMKKEYAAKKYKENVKPTKVQQQQQPVVNNMQNMQPNNYNPNNPNQGPQNPNNFQNYNNR